MIPTAEIWAYTAAALHTCRFGENGLDYDVSMRMIPGGGETAVAID